MTETTIDAPARPWVGVSATDQRLLARGWHVHFLAGVPTRVPDDEHAELATAAGITWTYEPET